MNRATSDQVVVLDRDGTMVVDRDYLADPEGLELLPGTAEGLQRLHRSGYRLVVISNQSGVGRGLFSLERLQEINARLVAMVHAIGADIAAIYCCPHRPDEDCACRKPKTQLLLQAARELGFKPSDAIIIGDKPSDVEFGRRVGAITVLIASDPQRGGAAAAYGADHVVADLSAAARLIESMKPAASGQSACSHTCT